MPQNKELPGLAGSWAVLARTARTQQHRHEREALRGTLVGMGAIVLAFIGPIHWLFALPVALAIFAWNTRGWDKAARAAREADSFQGIADGLAQMADRELNEPAVWLSVEPERRRIAKN